VPRFLVRPCGPGLVPNEDHRVPGRLGACPRVPRHPAGVPVDPPAPEPVACRGLPLR